MPRVVDADLQRAEIRRAARRAFARRGLAGTGLVHVAEELGVARSGLYHYYPDKAALVRDLARDLLREEEAMFAAALAGTGPVLPRIERLLRELPAGFAAWSPFARMIFDLWSRDARAFRPFFRRLRRDLTALIEQGQRAGEIRSALAPELAAATVIGAIDGLLLQHLVDPGWLSDPEVLGDELAALVRRALSP